jgi:hypothetical protein
MRRHAPLSPLLAIVAAAIASLAAIQSAGANARHARAHTFAGGGEPATPIRHVVCDRCGSAQEGRPGLYRPPLG